MVGLNLDIYQDTAVIIIFKEVIELYWTIMETDLIMIFIIIKKDINVNLITNHVVKKGTNINIIKNIEETMTMMKMMIKKK
ncbi:MULTISPECIES: hypothetical protein [Flavobacterium]|uniref:hypothetical protein n=1 Tax=Flavobacterium TaxID=237 RepID=UPI001F37B905|nr:MULTISPECIES: hypothetical protein [Flavobacterium]